MPSDRPPLTQARLKELLHYDPETGHFTWLVSNSNARPAGTRAGAINTGGHRQIRIDRRSYMAHRLAFLYVVGGFPPNDVDHINRVRDDNRWVNLRPAARWENMGNVGLQSNNTSGSRGVSWHTLVGKWSARGTRNGKRINLGFFTSLEEADAAARAWRKENFGLFAV